MSAFTYDKNGFYLDGEPFRIVSGTMHYFRIVPEYWLDRLTKLRACGFNTVETYTCWNLHERREGEFDFSGILDVERYVETAASLGLKVILRPGPYICAEWDMGGLPSWLLNYPKMRIRCYDEEFLAKVRRYYTELFRRLTPHLVTNGGNIIMVQIENEYGSYGDDKRYLGAVEDIYRDCGVDCLLFTSDGPTYFMLNGGMTDNNLATVNFGSSPTYSFNLLKELRPDQPSMCTEYWNGWFDHWYEYHHTRTADDTATVFDEMLSYGASVNFYMFHGGTNFAFNNGANYDANYQPTVTSYDYDAPLTEAGDITPKYYDVKNVIEKHFGPAPALDVHNSEKAAYGKLKLSQSAPLFSNLGNISTPVVASMPLTMEELGGDFGFVLYSTTVKGPCEELELIPEHVRDRALIYIDGVFKGIMERTRRMDKITIKLGVGESVKLDILVENMGRVNYGSRIRDEKGIVGGIRFGQQYHFGWEMRYLPMEELSLLKWSSCAPGESKDGVPCYPAFMRGELEISGEPADTFVRLDGFTKGIVIINGFNLGRYWNPAGPQKTLYVPAPVLKKGKNEVVVFELEGDENQTIEFLDKPDLGSAGCTTNY